jgi:predicted MFS family arabinose efflux permease
VGVLTSLAIWFMLPHGIKGDRRGLSERLGVLSVPGLAPALATILLYMAGPFAAFIYLGPVTTRLMGLDAGLLPFIMLAYGVGAALGNTVGGQMSDRVGAQATVTIAAALNIVFLLLLGAIPMLPVAAITPVFFGFMLLWGIAGWMFVPGQVSRVVALSPSSAPLALSLNASFLYLGTALGALVGGFVLEHLSINELGLVAAVFPTLALGVIYVSRPKAEFVPRLG